MRVLVTGSAGQVGAELLRAEWPEGWLVHGLHRAELDIRDEASVDRAVAEADLVVNAAAYTAVDRAETEREAAFAVNAVAPGLLAAAAARHGAMLIHLSTDYVFDGTKTGPYTEDDPVRPLGVYGTSKEQGEQRVRAALDRHVILRTAWVFGATGNNFVKTMLRLGAERPELRVVDDQIGCPTAAGEIARACAAVAVHLRHRRAGFGTYHFAAAPRTSWAGFARSIFELAGIETPVRSISTAEYPTPARRPANSQLSCERFRQTFGMAARPWRESLTQVLAELGRLQTGEHAPGILPSQKVD